MSTACGFAAASPARRARSRPAIVAICAGVALRANGRFWRVSSSAVGPSLRSSAAAQATAVSTVSHGRQTSRFGIRRRLAACSTDWCVGPSSPRPIESCVNTKIDAQLHQRRHAQRVARVVGEREEGAAVRDEAAVQREAVHDRRHAELAHAVVDVVARPSVARGDRRSNHAVFQFGEVRAGQVGRAADQLRQRRRERLERVLRGLARGDRLGLARARADGRVDRRRASSPAARRAMRRVEFGGELRDARARRREARRPTSLRRAAPRSLRVPARVDVVGNLERRVRPAERCARRRDFVVAERRAVRLGGAALFGAPLPIDGLAADQRRPVGRRCACAIAASTASTSWPSTFGDHVPAVGLEALRRVVGEPAARPRRRSRCRCRRRARSACRAQRAGERAGFVRDAFHQAAVAEEHVGVVVDDRRGRGG